MSDQSTLGGDTVSEREIENKKKYAEKKRKNPLCEECGEPKEYVTEPMVSGVTGWFCHNDDCVMDS